MTTYKDNDLREALRRKYNDTPQLPADFMKRMQKSTPKPTRRARHIYIAALAAAACIALVVMMVWPTNGSPVLTGGQTPCEVKTPYPSSPAQQGNTPCAGDFRCKKTQSFLGGFKISCYLCSVFH